MRIYDEVVGVRFSKAQRRVAEKHAKRIGLELSTWLRTLALAEIEKAKAKKKAS